LVRLIPTDYIQEIVDQESQSIYDNWPRAVRGDEIADQQLEGVIDKDVYSFMQRMDMGIDDSESADQRINQQDSNTGNRIQVSATPMTELIPVSTYIHMLNLYKRT
jgi:hypothetical protein